MDVTDRNSYLRIIELETVCGTYLVPCFLNTSIFSQGISSHVQK